MQPGRPTRIPAHQRLLAAAARVFARDGLTGATTREIAREASVNEVTLFRLFGSKERLIDAVVQQNFVPAEDGAALARKLDSGDLRKDLTAYGRAYMQRLKANLPLIRAMVGEIQHHGNNERTVFRSLFKPLREALVARIGAARSAGEVRSKADAVMLADLFTGMLFTEVIRRASADFRRDYTSDAYLDVAVDLIAQGAAR